MARMEGRVGILNRLFGRRAEDSSWQVPVVQEICIAMIRLVPEEWDSVAIVLEVTERGFGSGLTHSAITPKPVTDFALKSADFVNPDAAVMAATRKLELGWLERRNAFRRAIITAVKDENGWEIKSDYEHDEG